MNLEITDKKENPLLSRTELKGTISFDKATPSNDEVKKEIASKSKADESLVVVKSIYTAFGTAKADFNAYVYKSKKDMVEIEPKKKEKKEKKPKAEKPPEAQKKEEKKQEAPAEKPAEEKKQEAPKEEPKK